MKLHDTKVRVTLYSLNKKGLLESKESELLVSRSIAHGYKLIVPAGHRVMFAKNFEITCEKGCVIRISDTAMVVDKEGFHVPFQRESGTKRAVMYKIKAELFEILSQR